MADASQPLLLAALNRAVAEPGGLPLFASRTAAGLFANNTAGKQAARHCREAGLVHVLRTETRGKSTLEICAITEKGLALLLAEANPRPILESFVAALDARRDQVTGLLESARQSQAHLEAMRNHAEKVLQQVQQRPSVPTPGAFEKNGIQGKHDHDPDAAVINHLQRRQEAGTLGDCPLPELYRAVKPATPAGTIGQFHDVLRRLNDQCRLYLHPWTGPLYELPEPAFALLVGHEIAYYASLRT